MAVTVVCPNPSCATRVNLDDTLIGRKLRCKRCGQVFQPAGTTTDAAPPAKPATPLPDRIGRFEVRSRLGAGAFGTVYRAFDPQLEREVALKVPRPGTLDSPKRVQRFLREAKAAARLRHPNIVPVYEAGQEGETYFIVSAFVSGRPLSAAIPEEGLPPQQAARIARALAAAVADAHANGVVHRDIKPANVILDDAGAPHLTDFGLAARQDVTEKLTNTGAVLGTPAYMAPEQAAGQQGEAQPAGDQYSLGAVLYELLTGQPPFSGPPAVVLYNVIQGEPPPPRSLRATVPQALEAICLKAMAKCPEDRFADCAALADALGGWLDGAAASTPSPRLGRRRLLAAAAGAVLLAAVGAALVPNLPREAEPVAPPVTQLAPPDNTAAEPAKANEEARLAAENQRLKDQLERERKAAQEAVAAAAEAARARPVEANTKATPAPTPPAPMPKPVNPLVRTLTGHEGAAQAVAFSPDGRWLASGGEDNTTRVWDASSGREVFAFRKHLAVVTSVAFTADSRQVATAEGEAHKPGGVLRCWDARTGKVRFEVPGRLSVAFTLDGNIFAACGTEAEVHQEKIVSGVRKLLPVRINRTMIGVWEASGKFLYALQGHEPRARCVAVHPNGSVLASGGEDMTVRIWVPARRRTAPPLLGHTREVLCLAFSHDGKRLASGGADGTVAIWNVANGRRERILRPGAAVVSAVAFSPDDRFLAAGGGRGRGRPGTALLWDAETGEPVATLDGHASPVHGLTFDRSGTLLATASADGAVRVWDVAALTSVAEK